MYTFLDVLGITVWSVMSVIACVLLLSIGSLIAYLASIRPKQMLNYRIIHHAGYRWIEVTGFNQRILIRINKEERRHGNE